MSSDRFRIKSVGTGISVVAIRTSNGKLAYNPHAADLKSFTAGVGLSVTSTDNQTITIGNTNSLTPIPIVRTNISKIQAYCTAQGIAQPGCIISPREAFTDAGEATAATDGTLVQTLRDLSGNGKDAVQSTAGNRPTLRIAGFNNSLPALDFTSSTSNNIKTSGGVFTISGFNAGFTIYCVATSVGPASISNINVLLGIDANNFFALQNSANNAILKLNGTTIAASSSPGLDQTNYNGVYVAAWDGITATLGVNGNYYSGAIAGTPPTTGDLFIGGGIASLPWANGLVGDVWIFPGKHTQAQMEAIGAFLASDSGLLKPGYVFPGDSITQGFGTATPSVMNYAYNMCSILGATSNNILYENFGTPSEPLSTMITDVTSTNGQYLRTGYVSAVRGKNNIAFIFGGTNDMSASVSGSSAATAFASLKTLCALYRSQNCIVAVGTCLPRSAANAGADFETKRLAFNALIRAAGSSLYDILMDFGGTASPLGAVSSLSNTALYQADQIHPTQQGQVVLGEIAAQAVSTYYTNYPIANSIFTPQPIIKQVAGGTSGTALFSMPSQSSYSKEVIIICNALLGAASYTFPTPFINTPVVLSTSGLATALVSALSTTAMTVTGTTSTGTLIVKGY